MTNRPSMPALSLDPRPRFVPLRFMEACPSVRAALPKDPPSAAVVPGLLLLDAAIFELLVEVVARNAQRSSTDNNLVCHDFIILFEPI